MRTRSTAKRIKSEDVRRESTADLPTQGPPRGPLHGPPIWRVPSAVLALVFAASQIDDHVRLSRVSRHLQRVSMIAAARPRAIDTRHLAALARFPAIIARCDPQSLAVRDGPLGGALFTTFMEQFGAFTRLASLTIWHDSWRDDCNFYGALSGCRTILEFSFRGCIWTPDQLPALPALRSLHLPHRCLPFCVFRPLPELYPALEALEVGGVSESWKLDTIHERGRTIAPSVFPHLRALTYARLCGSTLTLEKLAVMPALTSLRLGSGVDLETCHVFLVFLAGLDARRLVRLHLSVQPGSFTDSTAAHHCSATVARLPEMPLLEEFGFASVALSADSIRHLQSRSPRLKAGAIGSGFACSDATPVPTRLLFDLQK